MRSLNPADGCRPTITSFALWLLFARPGKNPLQQQIDRVEVRPPVERAEKEDADRIALSRDALEKRAIDAVIDDIDVRLPEIRRE